MKRIKLTEGRFALVDENDYQYLKKWYWRTDGQGYAMRTEGTAYKGTLKRIYLHRLIMDFPKKPLEIDHINGNRLDNRRENLRICTKRQNLLNRLKSKNKKTSKYIGVNFRKERKVWRATIKINGKQISIGSFNNERHAAMARDIWAKELFGEFAKLNFRVSSSIN